MGSIASLREKNKMSRFRFLMAVQIVLVFVAFASAQVHYHKSGAPWSNKASKGPDAEVEGWFYNLGVTGIRVVLTEESPCFLLVKHVFKGSPAHGRVKSGDFITGAGGERFVIAHRNGYGMDKFGAHGPIGEFAAALEDAQTRKGRGQLRLEIRRDSLPKSGKQRGKRFRDVTLKVGRKYGAFSDTYPEDCQKSKRILSDLYRYLREQQKQNGSWGNPVHDTFAPLALLASGNKKHLAAVKRNVQMHAKTTSRTDKSSLINWRYMSAAIVMSEYYLATKEKWVVAELQEVYDFLISSQYTDRSQLNPKSKETHPSAQPKGPLDSHGGWGHNPGFEGYGPICMLTGQGALAFALMSRCGLKVDRGRHDAAYAFLARGTGDNGYLWYGDSPAGKNDWADMGRTGASAIANHLSPFQGGAYRKRSLAHARIIAEHPESFPDTHGSPIMGMGYAAIAAFIEPDGFRRLLDANKWWFTLAQCCDGTFYYQPNRDNAGYGSDSRLSASAVTAFILSIPRRTLFMTR